jgi:hypothetical protein
MVLLYGNTETIPALSLTKSIMEAVRSAEKSEEFAFLFSSTLSRRKTITCPALKALHGILEPTANDALVPNITAGFAKFRWTPAQDALMVHGMNAFGPHDWERIAEYYLPFRTSKQLQMRFKNQVCTRAGNTVFKVRSLRCIRQPFSKPNAQTVIQRRDTVMVEKDRAVMEEASAISVLYLTIHSLELQAIHRYGPDLFRIQNRAFPDRMPASLHTLFVEVAKKLGPAD